MEQGRQTMVRTGNIKTTVIRMENITKRFGGVYAVRDVSFDLFEGEVLALVGDNGAGKSTLMKILSGAYVADEGSIYLRGEKVKIENPKDSRRLGIETLYQNLALVNSLNIPSNVFMGREIRVGGILGKIGMMNLKKMEQEAFDLLSDFEILIPDPAREVNYLSGGQRQMVSIIRSVLFDARIIIMDEPTAALGVSETNKVYKFIDKVKEKGLSVIIISHNINEVFNVADRFMVMKNGMLVDIKSKNDTNINNIVSMIISGISC